jgi:hypothetical protein
VVGGSAIAFAAIPDSSGVIHACYRTNGGQVRVIDSPTETCNGNETATSWDKATHGKFVDDLVGADFSNTSLAYRNFANTDLTNAVIGEGSLNGTVFTGANLTSVAVKNEGTSNHLIQKANFTDANFEGGIYFLHETSFNNADLHGVSWVGSTISGVPTFEGSDFSNANLTGTDFSSAILTSAIWSNTICPDGTNSDDNGNTCIGHLVPYSGRTQ